MIQVIKDELNNDPMGRGYSGKDFGEILSLLREPISQDPPVFVQTPIKVSDAVTLLLRIDKFEGIQAAAANPAASGHAHAYRAIAFLQFGTGALDVNDTTVQETITGLVSSGLLSADDATNLLALGQKEIKLSRAEIIGVTSAWYDEINEALNDI